MGEDIIKEQLPTLKKVVEELVLQKFGAPK